MSLEFNFFRDVIGREDFSEQTIKNVRLLNQEVDGGSLQNLGVLVLVGQTEQICNKNINFKNEIFQLLKLRAQ